MKSVPLAEVICKTHAIDYASKCTITQTPIIQQTKRRMGQLSIDCEESAHAAPRSRLWATSGCGGENKSNVQLLPPAEVRGVTEHAKRSEKNFIAQQKSFEKMHFAVDEFWTVRLPEKSAGAVAMPRASHELAA